MNQDKNARTLAVYTLSTSILLLVFLLTWGLFGKIPTKVTGEGILINGGGSVIVYAPVSGVISDVSVYRDMVVEENDTLARITTESGEVVKVPAPGAGRIVSLEIAEDKPIEIGSEIGRILMQSDNADVLVAICYIPLADAGKVIPGMEMEVYPVGVNIDESGHMNALVSSSASYPSVKTEIVYDIGSDAIADSFLEKSPVITVKAALLKDPGSLNGYRWSNPKGGQVYIKDGMLTEASIIVGYESPFTLFLPFLQGLLVGGDI